MGIVVIDMKLTKIEFEIMDVLWASESPMTAAKIVAASPNRTWKEKSIQIIIRSLRKKGAVTLDQYVSTVSNKAVTYKPTITKEEYVISQIRESGIDIKVLCSAILEDKEYKKELAGSMYFRKENND